MKLRDNKWGFDLKEDNPFRIFPYLRQLAIDAVGEEQVLDLSRGNPGFGFAPSLRGRQLYAFLLEIDVLLNNADRRFAYESHGDEVFAEIGNHARALYSGDHAETLLADFKTFVEHLGKHAEMSSSEVVYEMFKYANASGGSYLDAPGESMVRATVAAYYSDLLNLSFDRDDVVFIQGVSHGIGVLFDVLTDPEIGFLKQGDTVLLQSPAYVPYNIVLESRGLNGVSLSVNPANGQIENLDEVLENTPESTKLMVLINPNNPTGFMISEEQVQKLADFARERDMLILTDDVYVDFFPGNTNMLHYAPERTIMFGGRSKIERATGIRFGEIVVLKEGQKYIAENILKGTLRGHGNLMRLLYMCKGPTHMDAALYHTTFVTGPSQYMGAAHMILGGDDRAEYLRRVQEMSESWYKILGMEYHGNLYYTTFDLRAVAGAKRGECEPEQLFVDLAKKGVVLLPASQFFSETDREKKDYRSFARASLPNLQPDQVAEAAKRVKEYMTE